MTDQPDNPIIKPRPDLETFGQVRIYTSDGQAGDFDLIMPWEQFVQTFLNTQAAIVRSGVINRGVIVKMFQVVAGAETGGNILPFTATSGTVN